ncbi:MBL fold metallo-hydrolase [Ornithinibacillus halophilus]|uniref:Glyoxylase, beta-lactamase superfamily II n=1 Tax=Ornithinibacillus halophilus TaxID=930117 RepID=A0A1M5D1J4_9BACI|nr:MBL fold metallo-hydrolase [Ornithinibacillus halophilus]SHF60889.1 Glyoxylase, beta-lactamase superfamily II [Ornithinibacillus halophilus]
MKVKSLSLGPLGTNCYILSKDKEALIVDPGGDASKIESYLTKEGITPRAILLTHAHFDHIGAVEEISKHYNIEVYIHEIEVDWLSDPKLNGSILFTGQVISINVPPRIFSEGNVTIGNFSFEVIHTPGHSPGSVSFVFEKSKKVFSGDVLFNQGIGRTDLPGGDFGEIERSIRNKLYNLSDDVEVYPGHGPSTFIGFEKNNNPFVPF